MKKKTQIEEITIIGPGLIGSSLGLALKEKKIVKKIIGIDKNRNNLNHAIKNNSIDYGFTSIGSNISNSNIIFLCTPVGTMNDVIKNVIPFIKKEVILTDVGSVKSVFKQRILNQLSGVCDFIPGHPIAGTEFSGAENAKKNLFNNKWCILTPQSNNSKKNIQKLREVWESIGMHVSIMTSDDHDKIMSITSHLPHLIAFTIVGTAFDYNNKEKKKLLNFSAGGFRDFTRIASSDPTMWRDIFINNKKNIVMTVNEFISDLKKFRDLINTNQSKKIFELIKKTKSIRKRVINLKQD